MSVAERLSPLARVKHCLENTGATQLAVGPMSRAAVDAVVDYAGRNRVPLMLIPSRRQVECAELGGGYVEGWTTEAFARYVRERDREGFVALCRDHSGPWHNDFEVSRGFSLEQAMRTTKVSLKADIDSGFDMLHLDPTIDPRGPVSAGEVMRRTCELYEFCEGEARRAGRRLDYEIGTEENDGALQKIAEFEWFLVEIGRFCAESGFPKPLFVVGQTGTLVRETRNVGVLTKPYREAYCLPAEVQLIKILELCREHGFRLKEHNADYLEDQYLTWHPRFGINAVNVAPEYGVCETRAILELCGKLGLSREADEFLSLAYDSGKWRKWLVKDSAAGREERAVMAGHYVFAAPAFRLLRERIAGACRRSGEDLEAHVRGALTRLTDRYGRLLGLLAQSPYRRAEAP